MSSRPPSVNRNFAILAVGQLLGRLLAFAVTIHLTRALAADGFGAIAFATSVLAYAALVVELGFDSLGPLEVARGQQPVAALAQTVVTLRLLLTGAGFAALAGFAWLAPVGASTRAVMLVYGVSLLANAIDLSWVFLGSAQMQSAAIADIVTQLLQALGAFLLVKQPGDLLRMPTIFLASRALSVAWLAGVFARRYGAFRPRIDPGLVRRLLPATLPFSGANMVGTLLQNFDLVLIGLWLGTRSAGVYGAAYRVVWLPTILFTAYLTALRPLLARGSLEGLGAIQVLLWRPTRFVVAAGVGAALGGILLAQPLVLLLYGTEYREAARPLQILLAAFALLVVSRLYRAVLVAFHHQATDLRIMASAAALNVALNVVLIRPFGLAGAAFATLASEAVILAVSRAVTRRLVGSTLSERQAAPALAKRAAWL